VVETRCVASRSTLLPTSLAERRFLGSLQPALWGRNQAYLRASVHRSGTPDLLRRMVSVRRAKVIRIFRCS
jgi:hypothetical protein